MFDIGSIVQHFDPNIPDTEDVAMHWLMILLEWLVDLLGQRRLVPAVVPARADGGTNVSRDMDAAVERSGYGVRPLAMNQPVVGRRGVWIGGGVDRPKVCTNEGAGTTALTVWLSSFIRLGCFAPEREGGVGGRGRVRPRT